GLASFKRNGKWGYVDSKGQVAIEAQFGYAGTFQGGVAGFTTVDDDEFGKWGVINKRGNKILPMIFPWFKSCKNGFCIVRGENNKDGFASLKGNWITKPEYDNAYQFHEGLAAVNQGELWGFINEKGELVINYQYEQVIAFPNDPFNGGFSGGIAKVQSDGTQFFIDKSGNCVLGCLE
ncbi:MAG: WG repeat-containing protein, partial [Saprospiraceae bacterium]